MPKKNQPYSIGKRVGKDLYVHKSALNQIPKKAQENLNDALGILTRKPNDWNILRLSGETVAFLKYDNFDSDPFPQLSKSTAVDLVRRKTRETNYSDHSNRPILHRKELMLPLDYPHRRDFEKLTQSLESFGLFYEKNRIGYKNQWTNRLKERGVVINGHKAEIANSDKVKTIDRHKTALVRYQLSQPVKLLLRHGLLSDGKSFFDYGCGKGSDLNGLKNGSYNAHGWDPHYAPEAPHLECDIVNLGFVLNVIEAPKERSKALKTSWSLTKEVLVISVMTPSADLIENAKPYGDGFLTSRGTFQKYFMQEELRDYIKQILDENPVAIAPGIFLVFRDKLSEQTFLLERYNRHKYRAVTISPDRPKTSTSLKPEKEDLLQPQLEQLWHEILDHGRYVSIQEIPNELAEAFRAERVSFKRAEQYCRDKFIDEETLGNAAKDRREDLLVYFALETFSNRQPYRQLQKTLQNDVKSFFGGHASALIEAKCLLFSVGDISAIQAACEKFSDLDYGYIFNDDQMILHPSVLDLLPPILRCYIGCAGVLYGDISTADLIKIHIGSGKLTLQNYDDFSQALPVLTQRVKIDMRMQNVRIFNYKEDNKQYLYMKSLFIPDTHHCFDEQSKFDSSLQKLGLFDFSQYGPRANYFDDTLLENSITVEGYKLVNS